MSKNRIILILKASDIDVSSLPEDRRDIKSRAFKDAVYDHLLKNYGVSGENIIVHIQNDIITIEWSPQEKDESFDAEFQRSMRHRWQIRGCKIHHGRYGVPIAERYECTVRSGDGLQRVP
ncbi:MAG: hypothetical protein KKA10_10745 [Euryarchaeota archaeon]|nr:hypothetical protein [Euryarchaeota archaeon]MCG2734776.1 hypothetical protein [Candidatus Methanoperedenaceae archaeon]